jgi:hypothetical protein
MRSNVDIQLVLQRSEREGQEGGWGRRARGGGGAAESK